VTPMMLRNAVLRSFVLHWPNRKSLLLNNRMQSTDPHVRGDYTLSLHESVGAHSDAASPGEPHGETHVLSPAVTRLPPTPKHTASVSDMQMDCST
jgi:hypothetical protein